MLLRAAAYLGAPHPCLLLGSKPMSKPINLPSSSSASSCPALSLCCSCYGLLPTLTPLSSVCWLAPSPSTSLPHPLVLRRAPAAAATVCSSHLGLRAGPIHFPAFSMSSGHPGLCTAPPPASAFSTCSGHPGLGTSTLGISCRPCLVGGPLPRPSFSFPHSTRPYRSNPMLVVHSYRLENHRSHWHISIISGQGPSATCLYLYSIFLHTHTHYCRAEASAASVTTLVLTIYGRPTRGYGG